MTETNTDSPKTPRGTPRLGLDYSARFLPGLLVIARLIFASTLLFSIVGWNDDQWTEAHFVALFPLVWAVGVMAATISGNIRWKLSGRVLIFVDQIICAITILLFPSFSLAAATLAMLTMPFLFMRYDGQFAIMMIILPLLAVLLRTQLAISFLPPSWPATSAHAQNLGDVSAVIIAIMVLIGAIPVSIRFQLMRKQFRFDQFSDDITTENPQEQSIEPIVEQLAELFPNSKTICIIDNRKKKNRIAIVGNRPNTGLSEQTARKLLNLFGDWKKQALLVDLKASQSIDTQTGEISSLSSETAAWLFQQIGIDQSAIIDFQAGRSRGRIFFATAERIDEVLLQEVMIISRKLDRYFKNVTNWYDTKRNLIAHARELARRDLHDGVLQSLAALKMRLVTQVSGPVLQDHPGMPALRKTIDIITLEQARLRALLHTEGELDSPIDLIETLSLCLKTLALQWEIVAELDSREPALPVDRESAENIEHLVREAVANAIRHAKAKHIIVSVALGEHHLLLTLKDKEASPEPANQPGKDAMAIMQSRSLMQRLTLVNGSAYSEGMSDGALLAVRIPMDFLVDA